MPVERGSLEERLLNGDRRALARLLTNTENGTERGRAAIRALYPHTGHAHTIGVTGSPGAGKSTVVGALALEYRQRGSTVGIVAVDPSSPFTTGAILGDRVRMQSLTSDSGIFIRSLATRGALGGLSDGVADALLLLDAFGKDVILIETVGAGQDEVEIAGTAQTTVLINTPGMGDDIQTMKAGIMEIADVHAVNKADLPGADILIGQLKALLSLSTDKSWDPPIVRMIATERSGIAELADACGAHRTFLTESGRLTDDERDRARHRIVGLTRNRLLADLLHQAGGEDRLEPILTAVVDRTLDPHAAVDLWLQRPDPLPDSTDES
jgi:LAO/AO transport system kinase